MGFIMQYFIYNGDKFIETNSVEYELWSETVASKYLLPEIADVIVGKAHYIQTMFIGEFNDGDKLRPFTILYFEAEASGTTELYDENGYDKEEHFDNYEDYKKRYYELLEMIIQKKKAGNK
ncbi:MAG: hypothetical protein H7Y00_06910 [Fimbriimonadaceae bacterium]|nr:hypothetical protein [Chitinophagales bacterium]